MEKFRGAMNEDHYSSVEQNISLIILFYSLCGGLNASRLRLSTLIRIYSSRTIVPIINLLLLSLELSRRGGKGLKRGARVKICKRGLKVIYSQVKDCKKGKGDH